MRAAPRARAGQTAATGATGKVASWLARCPWRSPSGPVIMSHSSMGSGSWGSSRHGPEVFRNSEFGTYARLLRWRKKNLAQLPRVPDPESPRRRWAYVWPSQAEAEEFAAALNESTQQKCWRAQATAAPASDGPFGPVILGLSRQGDGMALMLDSLSLVMIQTKFPNSVRSLSYAFANLQTWENFQKAGRGLSDLVRDVILPLTGLGWGPTERVGVYGRGYQRLLRMDRCPSRRGRRGGVTRRPVSLKA